MKGVLCRKSTHGEPLWDLTEFGREVNASPRSLAAMLAHDPDAPKPVFDKTYSITRRQKYGVRALRAWWAKRKQQEKPNAAN